MAAYSAEGELLAGVASYNPSEGDNVNIIGGAARATFWLSPNTSAQLDGGFESWNFTPCCGSWNIGGIVGHVNMRNQNNLLGVFGGLFDTDSSRVGAVGVEGQLYQGNITLEGRVGFFQELDDSDTFVQFRGAARFFLNPDFMAEVNAGFQNANWGENTSSIGAVFEHKLAMAPVSFFASVDYGHSSYDYSVTAARLGIKVLVNQPNLRAADKTGSSLGRGFDFQYRVLY